MHKKYCGKDLTIVVCAYKECDMLEKSVKAILGQTEPAIVKISTSTPNDYIENIAKKYNLEMCVNPDGGHVKDYNFALNQIDTPLGMLAHQDDILNKHFVERNIQELNKAKNPIISFSNYLEMRNGVVDNKPSFMIKIKRIMVWPLFIPFLKSTVFNKRLFQCIGDPIVHPSVIHVMDRMPDPVFDERFHASMDWDLWERLSHEKGEFVYVKDVLLYHRMSEENATAVLIATTNYRYEEELEVMSRFIGKPLAKFVMKFYSKSQNYY